MVPLPHSHSPPPGVHKRRNTQQARESPWEVEVGVVCFPGGRALLKPASVPRKAPHPLLNQGFLLAVRKKLQSIREMNFLWKQLPLFPPALSPSSGVEDLRQGPSQAWALSPA